MLINDIYGNVVNVVLAYNGDGAPFIKIVPNNALTTQAPPECPVPNPNETNKGKQILQAQQNIICRLNSLRQLLQQLQKDMAEHSPDAAAQIRTKLLYPNALLDNVRDVWLYDTRKLVASAQVEQGNKDRAAQANAVRHVESLRLRPDTVRCTETICKYPKCNCPGGRLAGDKTFPEDDRP